MPSITVADAGRQVVLSVGESFSVILAGNPTTGYQWEVVELNTALVKQIGAPDYKPSSAAIGAGGQFTFRFQAASVGQASLRLVYRRPFEKKTPPLQTFEVTLVVK